MKYDEGLKILRFNRKTGKWYKDGAKPGNMTVYLLSDEPCEICGDTFFYCSGNKGTCCSLKCNTLKKNKMYGISEETAKKISKAHIGMIASVESRVKHSETNKKLGKWCKENNPSWKGGVDRQKRHAEYRSPEYNYWRRKVFERDHFTCALCGKIGGRMQAHHIKTREKYPELTLDENNGITLCKGCHEMIRHKEEKFEKVFEDKVN